MRTIRPIFFALLLSNLMLSCSKDDDTESPTYLVVADLFEDTSIMENSSATEFRINLNEPAQEDGYIILKVTSTKNNRFQTNPPVENGEIELEVLKGSTFSAFEFTPVNNNQIEENSTVTFKLEESSDGILFGSKSSTTIEITDDDSPATASFITSSVSLIENNIEGVEVRIHFSGYQIPEGSLVVEVEGNTNDHFISSYPALDQDQKISIPVPSGTVFTTFQIYPKDNALLENHQNLKLKLVSNSAGVVIGELSEINLVLLDDEIKGKIKSVETITKDGKRDKKTWEYAIDGKVSKVLWENNSTSIAQGTDIYYYSGNGLIESVSAFPGDGENFIWENGKVVRSEVNSGFAKTAYSIYDYNSSGKIQTKTIFHIQTDGSFKTSGKHEYEYHSDGNLKKESIFKLNSNNIFVFETSLSFDTYLDKGNPAPIEIIPTLKVQQLLPLYYTYINEGVNINHYYINKFNAEGQLFERGSQTETVFYTYY